MPLLIHAAGWWLLGLFAGAMLGEPATRPAWLARVVWAPTVAVIVLLVLLSVFRASRTRRPRSFTGLSLAGIGLAGVLASVSAASDARLCRAAAVERMARGAWVSLRFDGATTERAGTPRPGTAPTAPAG